MINYKLPKYEETVAAAKTRTVLNVLTILEDENGNEYAVPFTVSEELKGQIENEANEKLKEYAV